MISKQGLQARLIGTIVAAALAFGAAVFLAIAAYLALLEAMSGTEAALVMAAAFVLLLLLTWLVVRLVRRQARRARPSESLATLEQALQLYAGPAFKDWVRQHPNRAALLSVLAGVAAGYSPSVGQSMQDVVAKLVREEQDR